MKKERMTAARLAEIKGYAASYKKRADEGRWMESDGNRQELLDEIDALFEDNIKLHKELKVVKKKTVAKK